MADNGTWEAIVLAGGGGRRLGGVDKAELVVGGVRLLDGVLAAVAGAARVVGVGPERAAAQPVLWVREVPPGGGPVAGIAAALPLVTAVRVVVLAVDLPFVTAAAVAALLAAADPCALAVDGDGRDQVLLAAWRTAALREAMPGEPAGARARDLVPPGAVRLALSGEPPPWTDCDTAAELAAAREPLDRETA